MTAQSLQGKRALVTHADVFMGPALCEMLASQGAIVIGSASRARCHWGDWWVRRKTPPLWPTCAATRPTASLARCFRCAAAG